MLGGHGLARLGRLHQGARRGVTSLRRAMDRNRAVSEVTVVLGVSYGGPGAEARGV